MKILYGKKFIKSFQKLKKNEQLRVKNTIATFQNNTASTQLKNHALLGKYDGLRSINAGGDLRLIFSEKGGYIEILFLDLGTHSQLY